MARVRGAGRRHANQTLLQLLFAAHEPGFGSGPINAIVFDRANGTLRGGSSNHGEDYGIGW